MPSNAVSNASPPAPKAGTGTGKLVVTFTAADIGLVKPAWLVAVAVEGVQNFV
jgi:hypothetical protein